jgi:enoyl-CoA hydratase/carnithine racemase
MNRLDLTLHNDGIAVVTLSDPPMNTMDAPLLEELCGLFEGLGAAAAVHAAVITGQGRAFSAGLNLKTVPELDRLGQRRVLARARGDANLPPQAFATTKRELRAAALGRITQARAGRGEPRLSAWLGDEMRRAAAAVLRRAA